MYCVADGSLKPATGLWRIRVKRQHKVDELHRCLIALGIGYKTYIQHNYTSFNFYLPELEDWNFKGLDRKLLDMSQDQFKVLLDAYSLSDGNRNGRGVIIYTSKPGERDLLQELAVLNGHSCTVHSRTGHGFSDKESYSLSVYPRQQAICSAVQHMTEEDVVNEHVWCIRNTNANFFIRRNGKVHLTGNCHGSFQGQGKTLDVGLDNSYNIFGEHKMFSEDDVLQFMQGREVYIAESHRNYKER